MKRFFAICLALAVSLSLISCGKNSSTPDNSGGNNAAESITLRYATQHPTDHIAQQSAEAIKAEVEEKTNGRIKIEIYPASSLGDFEQMYGEVMQGSIDIAHISVPDRYDPRCNISLLPYLCTDYDELLPMFGEGSYIYDKLTEYHSNLGVKFLGIYAEGFCGVGIKKPIQNANVSNTDKGVLIRCAGIDAHKAGCEQLGFRASTIPYSETFTAIQTGLVDGWIGGPPNLNYLTFRDVIKYYYQYSFFAEATTMCMNKKLFDSLSAEDQTILIDAFNKQINWSYEICESEDEKYRQLLRDEGIEVIEFSDEERLAMAEDIRANMWTKPQIVERYTQEFMDGIRDAAAEVSGS